MDKKGYVFLTMKTNVHLRTWVIELRAKIFSGVANGVVASLKDCLSPNRKRRRIDEGLDPQLEEWVAVGAAPANAAPGGGLQTPPANAAPGSPAGHAAAAADDGAPEGEFQLPQ